MDTETEIIAGEFVSTVVSKFKVDKIILFGSRARGDYNDNSDFDFFVVMGTDKSEIDQTIDVGRSLRYFNYPMDLLLLTPEHFNDGFFLKDTIVREGVVLYERNN